MVYELIISYRLIPFSGYSTIEIKMKLCIAQVIQKSFTYRIPYPFKFESSQFKREKLLPVVELPSRRLTENKI
jgi:hypothetical protein